MSAIKQFTYTNLGRFEEGRLDLIIKLQTDILLLYQSLVTLFHLSVHAFLEGLAFKRVEHVYNEAPRQTLDLLPFFREVHLHIVILLNLINELLHCEALVVWSLKYTHLVSLDA